MAMAAKRNILDGGAAARPARPARLAGVARAVATATILGASAFLPAASATGAGEADNPASQPVLRARSGIAIFYLAHADAQSLAQILQQLFAGETAAVVSDSRTNCVIVSGGVEVIEKARLLIARLDVAVATRPVLVVGGRAATRPATQAATEPGTRPATRPAPSSQPAGR